ncbi:MAG: phosphoribosyl-ATP diphosphatase, partial [Deltaproteobacteria bacterium]|nr:phosphoribosyl-ATP diphosphatase [Deltaproteobacteria bacterium]
MLIPSIDIMDGNAVQLIGGREKVIDAGDPFRLAEQFSLIGEIAVIDLDAALGRGSNSDLIAELVRIAPCRVGGGIRSVSDAVKWLDAGARKVILGTAAVPEVLKELPPERVIAALDSINDDVVIQGWRKKTGRRVVERLQELS